MQLYKHLGKKSDRGFSLVELVIVIVIIGILAAIALPRVGRGAKAAGESALASNLAVLRNSIELYASQHNGDYPGAKTDGKNAANTPEAFVGQITKYSKEDGTVADAFDGAGGFVFGPYLRKGIPPSPVGTNKGSTDVAIDAANSPPAVTAGTEGWAYNPGTGDLIVNSDADNERGTKTYDAY